MPISLQSVISDALQLSEEDREILLARLVDSLEPASDLSPEWEDEIARRVADLDAGRTQFIPAEEALARLSAHILSRRPAA